MNSGIIFFDIDGTILSNRTKMISDSTKNAIRRARDNGYLTFVNSGRTFAEIDELPKSVGFDGYVCGCGTHVSYRGEVLLHASLPAETCRNIIKDLHFHKLEAVLEGTDAIYFNASTAYRLLIRMRESYKKHFHFNVQDWDASEVIFDKLCIWSDDPGQYSPFMEKYSELLNFIDREGNLFEIVPKGYSKATGIEFICSRLNIPHENTYALGDGANDLPMLNYVKHSIGMGNSSAGVVEAVSFLTKDVDQDGVEYALRHFGII